MNLQFQNKELMVKESIKHFLASYQNGSSDFSSFESIFFRLIQTMLDPPLEITWFYSAVTVHAAKSNSQGNPSAQVLVVKDMFKLLISCSNLSCASKKIVLLAPVLYELYNIVLDCRKGGLSVNVELENLVDNMVNYVTISAGVHAFGNSDVEHDNAVVCFEDLVRVWVADRSAGRGSFGENLKVFFPLLNDGIWKSISPGCSIRHMVGIVLCEVFLLRLLLTLSSGMSSEDMVKETQNLAVQSMKGFQNCYFLDILLKMLLEPNFPIADLLSSENAVLLYKTLYDVILLVDCSFYSGNWVRSHDNHSNRLALKWVLVADRAIQYARATTDKARVASYLDAFCGSQLVADLSNWASLEAQSMNVNTRPDISNPKALIKWLLVLEDQGIRVFHPSTSALHAKAVACASRADNASPELLCIKNLKPCTKDQEMIDLSSNEFPSSICSMDSQLEACRKRKESLTGLHESRMKQLKRSGFCGSPFGNIGGLHCGGEVKNAASDDDMELVG